jgi:sugar diacid utilization regulator
MGFFIYTVMENSIVFSLPSNLISSLVLCEQINIFRQVDGNSELAHKTLLAIIRDEFEEEIAGQEILLGSYLDKNNQSRPMFNLTHSQAKQVLVRESKTVRKAVIAYIERLEKALPNFNNPAEAARAWALEYEAKQLAERKVENLTDAIGRSLERASILRVAQSLGVHENTFDWRKLKKHSDMLGLEVRRVPSTRYQYQNTYHIDAFKSAYPQFDYSLIKDFENL